MGVDHTYYPHRALNTDTSTGPEFHMEDTVAGSKGFRCSSWVASISRI
jgi:hypothetical protein